MTLAFDQLTKNRYTSFQIINPTPDNSTTHYVKLKLPSGDEVVVMTPRGTTRHNETDLCRLFRKLKPKHLAIIATIDLDGVVLKKESAKLLRKKIERCVKLTKLFLHDLRWPKDGKAAESIYDAVDTIFRYSSVIKEIRLSKMTRIPSTFFKLSPMDHTFHKIALIDSQFQKFPDVPDKTTNEANAYINKDPKTTTFNMLTLASCQLSDNLLQAFAPVGYPIDAVDLSGNMLEDPTLLLNLFPKNGVATIDLSNNPLDPEKLASFVSTVQSWERPCQVITDQPPHIPRSKRVFSIINSLIFSQGITLELAWLEAQKAKLSEELKQIEKDLALLAEAIR